MGRKRSDEVDPRQIAFPFARPGDILTRAQEFGDGNAPILFEAPEASRLVSAWVAPVPRIVNRSRRTRRAGGPASLGLPFGLRQQEGTVTCWSCAKEVEENLLVQVKERFCCPGCGAPMPFAE